MKPPRFLRKSFSDNQPEDFGTSNNSLPNVSLEYEDLLAQTEEKIHTEPLIVSVDSSKEGNAESIAPAVSSPNTVRHDVISTSSEPQPNYQGETTLRLGDPFHLEPPSSLSKQIHKRKRESRSATPPFVPGTPSAEYIKLASQPARRILPMSSSSPSQPSKKLLVLDLNGTLVFRSPKTPGKDRPVHPRPYMNVFSQFLSKHDRIETMIWSSAQQHSVDAMVERAFGPMRSTLKAVWARDTLGLSAADFARKVQTVKDLEILWRKLVAAESESKLAPSSDPPHSSPLRAPHSPIPIEEPELSSSNSALNTILLDDSALKAHLQPYNHIPLPEYDIWLRRSDIISLTHEMEKKREVLVSSHDLVSSESISSPPINIHPSDQRPPPTLNHPYDRSLIAIIGILDEITQQSSVCSWIYSDGLWAGFKDEAETLHEPEVVSSQDTTIVDSNVTTTMRSPDNRLDPQQPNLGPSTSTPSASAQGDTGNSQNASQKSRTKKKNKKKRKSSQSEQNSSNSVEEQQPELGVEAASEGPGGEPETNHPPKAIVQNHSPAEDVVEGDLIEVGAQPNEPSSVKGKKRKKKRRKLMPLLEEDLGPGNGLFVGKSPSPQPPITMWFHYEPCFEYWVSRGLEALERLEIPVEHGLELPGTQPKPLVSSLVEPQSRSLPLSPPKKGEETPTQPPHYSPPLRNPSRSRRRSPTYDDYSGPISG